MAEPTFIASDEVQVKGRKRKAEIDRERTLNDLRVILSTETGRRATWRQLESLYKTSFSTNALSMAHAEGQRNVALNLLADCVEADPNLFLLMEKEAIQNKEIANA